MGITDGSSISDGSYQEAHYRRVVVISDLCDVLGALFYLLYQIWRWHVIAFDMFESLVHAEKHYVTSSSIYDRLSACSQAPNEIYVNINEIEI